MSEFGQRLKAIRKDIQLTQAELAEKLMVSVQSVSKWECGNSMPDISQIVPLASVLGVTTDCLLGMGGDEEADRRALREEIRKLEKGIEKVYSRKEDVYRAGYELYKAHIQKYPLDYEVKLACADSITRCIYYGTDSEAEKDKLYAEAVALLKSVINCDRDTTRQIDAKQTLIILYLYRNDFSSAEEVAEGLPRLGSIRASMEIEIYSKKNDAEKCLALSHEACHEAVHHYLWALAMRARRLSLAGENRKQEAIAAWLDLIAGVKFNDERFWDVRLHTKWLYSGYNHLTGEYLTAGETEKALQAVEQLADALAADYRRCKEKGETDAAEELRGNFDFFLRGCCQWCSGEQGSMLSAHPRFQKCLAKTKNV